MPKIIGFIVWASFILHRYAVFVGSPTLIRPISPPGDVDYCTHKSLAPRDLPEARKYPPAPVSVALLPNHPPTTPTLFFLRFLALSCSAFRTQMNQEASTKKKPLVSQHMLQFRGAITLFLLPPRSPSLPNFSSLLRFSTSSHVPATICKSHHLLAFPTINNTLCSPPVASPPASPLQLALAEYVLIFLDHSTCRRHSVWCISPNLPSLHYRNFTQPATPPPPPPEK